MPFGVQRLIKQPVANASSLPSEDRVVAKAIGYRTSAYFALYDEALALLAEDKAGNLKLDPIPAVPVFVLTAGDRSRTTAVTSSRSIARTSW